MLFAAREVTPTTMTTPVRRDVVSTGTSTSDNTTIRFQTDNSGPWIMHWYVVITILFDRPNMTQPFYSHIDWHLELYVHYLYFSHSNSFLLIQWPCCCLRRRCRYTRYWDANQCVFPLYFGVLNLTICFQLLGTNCARSMMLWIPVTIEQCNMSVYRTKIVAFIEHWTLLLASRTQPTHAHQKYSWLPNHAGFQEANETTDLFVFSLIGTVDTIDCRYILSQYICLINSQE